MQAITRFEMNTCNNPYIYIYTVLGVPSIGSFHFCSGLSKAGLPDPNSYPKSGTMPEDVMDGAMEIRKGFSVDGTRIPRDSANTQRFA